VDVLNAVTIEEENVTSSGALSVYHAAIDELTRRYGGSDEAKHLTTEELLPPRGVFLVARLDGHPIGGVGLRPIGEPSHNFGEVKRLWVRPDLRRHHVGALLMAKIEAAGARLGYVRLYLETGYAQPEAVELYRGSGWTPVEIFPDGAVSYPHAYRFTKPL
jgi:GNAT superfamily N-acetyltransferase